MINVRAWFYLFLAIIAEVAATTCMKLSSGFVHLEPSIFIFFFYAISFLFFALAIQQLELGMAYATWAGLGTLLISLIGIQVFHEPVSTLKLLSLLFIIIGVIGLKEP